MCSVQAIHVHRQYDTVTNINDMAVLRVGTSFTFTKYVEPTRLTGGEPKSKGQLVIAD